MGRFLGVGGRIFACRRPIERSHSLDHPDQKPPFKHWLDVDYGRSVDGFQVAYEDAVPLDGHDLDPVQPDRVGPILGAGTEHAPLRLERVVAGMDDQYVPKSLMEPGEQIELVTGTQVPGCPLDIVFEYHPDIGRALPPLLRGVLGP